MNPPDIAAELRGLRVAVDAQRAAIDVQAAEIRALRAALAAVATSPHRPLADADVARLAGLLPVIFAACGAGAWTVADLCAASLLSGEHSAALRIALTEHAGPSLKAFGKFLHRCTDHQVDGFRLATAGRDRGGRLWSVVTLKVTESR